MPTAKRKHDHREQPTYWFAILEIAREKGNREQADEAIQQLNRLGVEVKYFPTGERSLGSTTV